MDLDRECGLEPAPGTERPVWAYAIRLEDNIDVAAGPPTVMLAIGGMHGHELSGSDCLLRLVGHARKEGRVVARTDLARCCVDHLADLMAGSTGGRMLWAVPTFSAQAACENRREENRRDNNRQFLLTPPAPGAGAGGRGRGPPAKAEHLSRLLLRATAARSRPPLSLTVLDYHNGFGIYGSWWSKYLGFGMGHAVYGTVGLVDEVVAAANILAKAKGGGGSRGWTWQNGSRAGTRYARGPVGSLREFCMHHRIPYVLVEISTERDGEASRYRDVADTLLAAARQIFPHSPEIEKMLGGWLAAR